MDKRNEYRTVPDIADKDVVQAQYRERNWFGGYGRWKRIHEFWGEGAADRAERACRVHAGEGTKYLGRLP